MDYSLNEGQEMLKKSARDFLASECPKSLVRQMVEDEKGYTPELWEKMAGLGWMGLAFPEKYGGTDGSFLDLVVLLEEMGRACLPGPFSSTVVLGGMTILDIGSEAQKQELLPEDVLLQKKRTALKRLLSLLRTASTEVKAAKILTPAMIGDVEKIITGLEERVDSF